MTEELCANCEEPIGHTPVYFDGRPYCCAGCVAGGPCVCTYEDEQPSSRYESRPRDAAARTSASGQRSTASALAPGVPQHTIATAVRTRPEHTSPPRAPIPFRRPGDLTIVVHASGFADQRHLLTFAGILEESPDFVDVSLTRVTEDEAWFTVRAASADDVATALYELPGFSIESSVDQNLVEAHIGRNGAESRTPSPPDERPLLPQRPRFRAFRPQTVEPPVEPGQPREPSSGPVTGSVPEPLAPGARLTPPPPTPPTPPGSPPAPPRRTASPPPPPEPELPRTAVPAADAPPPPAAPPPAAPPPAAPRVAEALPASSPPDSPVGREDDELVEPEDRPGGAVMTVEHLTLVVYPFHSFAALNEFQGAIRTLHGVKNTRVRRFYRGTLHLAVDYEDIIPLADRLADLRGFDFEITSETRSELEIVLRDASSPADVGNS